MPQEDKIKREIDRIGLMLAKLLSMLLHKGFENPEANTEFVQQFNAELDEFLALHDVDDIRSLVEEKNFSIKNLRDFGNLLYELAQRTSDEHRKSQLRQKALNVYEYITANSTDTLYLDVELRIKELRSLQ